jgi:hypothetical protein
MNVIQEQLTIDVPPALILEEMNLEMGMRDAGRVRFRRAIEKAKQRGQQDDTVYGDRIIYIDKVATGLDKRVAEGKNRAGARRVAQPFIEALSSRVIAMLGLKVICERLMEALVRII